MISLKNILTESMNLPFDLKTNGTGDFYIKLDGSNGGQPFLEKPTSGNFAAITTNKEALGPKYLYYVVLHLHNSGVFKYLQHGTTVPHITLQDIKKTILKFFLERVK
jgi:restriction endonuclease S subunit